MAKVKEFIAQWLMKYKDQAYSILLRSPIIGPLLSISSHLTKTYVLLTNIYLVYIEQPLLGGLYEKTYSFSAMTRKRPMTINDAEVSSNGKGQLVRCLTWIDLITYGLGATVGAGVSFW